MSIWCVLGSSSTSFLCSFLCSWSLKLSSLTWKEGPQWGPLCRMRSKWLVGGAADITNHTTESHSSQAPTPELLSLTTTTADPKLDSTTRRPTRCLLQQIPLPSRIRPSAKVLSQLLPPFLFASQTAD